jgi:uncharacterized protein (DUF1800 family)
MLQPYVPSPGDPYNAVKAAHLLNRATFGGTIDEIAKVQKLGPRQAVDWLLDFPDAPAEEINPHDTPDLSAIEGLPGDFRTLQNMLAGKTPAEQQTLRMQLNAANQLADVATGNWWVRRMAYGPFPLHEKLTFLWHGHFTTSANDERNGLLIWNQNELLRKHAAGNFREFVHAVSRDPAMIDYLNNQQNKKAHPNENYAREVMELFTLGIGNYTENDVKESARAFTGWTHDGTEFLFRPADHDTSIKKFLGVSGNLNGDDVIEIILRQPACSKYIAGRLYKWFVSDEPNPAISDSLAQVLVENDYDLRPALRTLLNSQAFYQPESIGVQIKSPVQLVVGLVRQLGLPAPDDRVLQPLFKQMGQIPFRPPNVKGWPGGHMWINTSTLFVRYNSAVSLTTGAIAGLLDSPSNPDELVNHWVDRLIQRPLDDQQKSVLVSAAGANLSPTARPAIRNDAARQVIQLIVSMPEYQVC